MNRTKPIRVLLVDDEEGFLDVLSKRMTRRRFEVMTAPCGGAAIQALKRYDFDVALVDLKMDDLDGIELLKIFKKMDAHLSVVILTGHGSSTAARDGLALGAFDYLNKPCTLEDLLNVLYMASRQTAWGRSQAAATA
jgi:DNA-binding NtrC family response regulator